MAIKNAKPNDSPVFIIIQPFSSTLNRRNLLQNLVGMYMKSDNSETPIEVISLTESSLFPTNTNQSNVLNFYKDQRRFQLDNALHNASVEFTYMFSSKKN